MTEAECRRPVRRAGLRQHRVTSGVTLVEVGTHRAHRLNHTAAAIWDLCDGSTSAQEMVEAVCDLSGMPPDVIEEDVAGILSQLDREKLIVWNEG
ncbi:MAG TPA: PqqD family protein [Actinomycetota bacterium]|nr:PqqD family protein [Actinomycetota bacterium]